MSWNYRNPRCKQCYRQSVTSTALGNPLCAAHASALDGLYYQDAAAVAWEKIERALGQDVAAIWCETIAPFPEQLTWKQVAELLTQKVAELLPVQPAESRS